MTTVELLAYCEGQSWDPRIPDLIWQRQMHREENLEALRSSNGPASPDGYHDMRICILEYRSWLILVNRCYATVLFAEGAA